MIFVDTSAFVARCLPGDEHHREAMAVWPSLARQRLFTSNFVVDEVVTLLGTRTGDFRYGARVGAELYDAQDMEILRPGPEQERAALTFVEKYADQGVSFTDAVSFVLMKLHRIRRALAFDDHFRLAGFQVIQGRGGRS